MAKRAVYDAVIAAPFGRLGIRLADGRLADIDFLDSKAPLRAPKNAAARRVCRELRTYLRNPKHQFSVPLVQGGTVFQQEIWLALRRIPAGRSLSYGELARRLKTGGRALAIKDWLLTHERGR